MPDFQDALIRYFEKHLQSLRSEYEWKIPPIEGAPMSGKSDYQANVDLKNHLNARWKQADQEERYTLSKMIVSDWGGVRSNDPETLEKYTHMADETEIRTPLYGVASYSKILSIAHPDRYAIYDARVASCLVALQHNAGVEQGIAFNYIAGRNNVTGNAVTKKGFVYENPFTKKDLLSRGWRNIQRDETYSVYMESLHKSLTHFPDHKLHDLEMVLFSRAVEECNEAMGLKSRCRVCCMVEQNNVAISPPMS